MADLRKTVDVVLNGRDRISRTFNSVYRNANRVSSALGYGGMGAVGLTAAAGTATTALAALGGVASGKLAEGLAAAYQEYARFESSLKDLEKVLGDQPELMSKAETAAHELAVQYGMSSGQIVDSIANWVQAGYDLDQAMTLAEDSIAATYASELNMSEATDTLTRVLKGFNVEVDGARGKLDAINAISNNYAASVGQLSEALGRAAPVAESVGLSMEQLASLMTPAIEKFQDGRRVGTAFKTMLTKLQDDSQPVQQALDTLGVKQKTANGEFRSGKAILYDVGEAFQGLDQEQQAFIASQIAGREHAAKFLATMGEWDQVSKIYNTAMDSAGSITAEVENRLEAASTQMDRLGSAGEVLAQVIGGQVAESFTNVIQSTTDIVGALQEAVERGDADEFFEQINEMADDLAGYLDDIAGAMPEAFEDVDFERLADAVERVGNAFGSWFDDLDLSKPDDLAIAINRILGGASELIETFALFVRAGDDVAAAFVNVAKGVQQSYSVLRSINSIWDVFIVAVGSAVGAYERFLKALDYVPGLDLSGAVQSVHNLGTSIAEYQLQLDKAREENKSFNQVVQETGSQAKSNKSDLEILGDALRYARDNAKGGEDAVRGFQNVIDHLEGKQVEVGAEADEREAREAGERAEDQIPDRKDMKAGAEADEDQIEKEMAKIEARAETAQKALEMEAKVEVAQAEAQAERVKAAFESASATIQDTSEQMGTLFDYLSDPGAIFSPSFYREVQDMIADEHESRQKLMKRQSELMQKEIQLMEEKLNSMRDGEGLIKIEGEGLEPELEAFMWKIVERVQLRVNEQSAEYLLNIGSA